MEMNMSMSSGIALNIPIFPIEFRMITYDYLNL